MRRGTFVVGYVRPIGSSSEIEDERDAQTQREAIDGLCRERDWRIREVLDDPSDSRARSDPEGLIDALALVARGEAGGLVLARLDAACRSVYDLGEVLRWFDVADGSLVAADVDLDTSTRAGAVISRVVQSVGDWERRQSGLRTRAGMTRSERADRGPGRAAVASDSELRGRIARMRGQGMTLASIADELNRDGVPTIRGGRRWRPSSIQHVLGYRRPRPGRRRLELPDPLTGARAGQISLGE